MKPLVVSEQRAFESQLCVPVMHSLVFSTCRLHLICKWREWPIETTLNRNVILELDSTTKLLIKLCIDFFETEVVDKTYIRQTDSQKNSESHGFSVSSPEVFVSSELK